MCCCVGGCCSDDSAVRIEVCRKPQARAEMIEKYRKVRASLTYREEVVILITVVGKSIEKVAECKC